MVSLTMKILSFYQVIAEENREESGESLKPKKEGVDGAVLPSFSTSHTLQSSTLSGHCPP